MEKRCIVAKFRARARMNDASYTTLPDRADAAYRLELEKIYREHMEREFDPTEDYNASEKSADDSAMGRNPATSPYAVTRITQSHVMHQDSRVVQ